MSAARAAVVRAVAALRQGQGRSRFPIAGCVRLQTIHELRRQCEARGISLSALVGELLERAVWS